MRHLMKASAAAVILLMGCSDTGGPSVPRSGFDAAEVGGNIITVRQVLDGAVWRSLRTLGPRFGAAGSAAALAGRLSATVGASGRSTLPNTGVGIAHALLSGGSAYLKAPQIPAAIRGVTFVLDSATLRYVPDSSRFGAPTNGVRFVLYAADSATQQPLPGQEIGYADLTDEAPPESPAIALRLQAVIANVTRLDYRVIVAGADSAGSLQAAGFTDDGTTRVEFQVGVQGARAADTSIAQVVFAIGIPSREFLATATLQHVALTGDSAGAIAMTVRQGFDQVGMVVHATPSELMAVFQVNGVPFATVRGEPQHPTVQGTDGHPLTAAEVDALIGIRRLSGQVMEMFDCLMRPVGGMLGGGVAA